MGRKNKKPSKPKSTLPIHESDKEELHTKVIKKALQISKATTEEITSISHDCTLDQIEDKALPEIFIDKNNQLTNKSLKVNENDTDTKQTLMIELKLEKRNKDFINDKIKINKGHRDFYINYLCQVCKQMINKNENCQRCHMVSYCSPEHRKQHWPIHGDLCNAIQQICKTKNKKHVLENVSINNNADMFRSYCYNLMQTCEKKIERKLEQWEVEMFLFPRICNTCYNWNIEELVHCSECYHISYCKYKPEHLCLNHKNYCHSLITYKNILLHQHENGSIKFPFPDTFSNNEPHFENSTITDVLQTTSNLNELEFIQLTEAATGPLTAANSVKSFNDRKNTSIDVSFTIHIVGAEKYFELSFLQKWETFFLHYFNKLKTLNVIFIGPEMNIADKQEEAKMKEIYLCENCMKQNRKINFEFHDKTFYHNYRLNIRYYKKPNLICAFNAGLYRTTGFNENDTWPETIKAMFKVKNTPVLITAYTSAEIVQDLKRVKEIQKCEIINKPSQNQFSSLKPNLNFVSYEEIPVIFKNYYYMLLSS